MPILHVKIDNTITPAARVILQQISPEGFDGPPHNTGWRTLIKQDATNRQGPPFNGVVQAVRFASMILARNVDIRYRYEGHYANANTVIVDDFQ